MSKIYLKNNFYLTKTWIFLTFLLIILLIFMTSCYTLLQNKLVLNDPTTIENFNNYNMSLICETSLTYKKLKVLNNTFTYEITISNNSKEDYQRWKLKILTTPFIAFPKCFKGIKEDNFWILDYNNNVIKKGQSKKIKLTFTVLDNPNLKMNKQDYAEYFINNFVFLESCNQKIPNYNLTNENISLDEKGNLK